MGKSRSPIIQVAAAIVIVLVVVSSLGIGIAVLTGNNNVIAAFWGYNPEDIEIIEPPPGEKTVLVSLDVYRRGVEGTDPDPTAYVWYDWDGDGQVDLGTYGIGDGEIETCSSSSGLISARLYYPSGGDVYFQLQKSLYETVTYKFPVPYPGANDLSTTVHNLGSVPMMLTETDSTDRVRVTARGSSPVLMVTDSGDYNYTLYGAEPTLDIVVTCATDDMGISTLAYDDWSQTTKKHYVGSFMAIAVTNTDNADVVMSGYDDVKTDGTYYWYIWNLPEIWNDASSASDGSTTKTFSITISGAFDIAYIQVFNELLETTYNSGSLSTGHTMQETNLDFIA